MKALISKADDEVHLNDSSVVLLQGHGTFKTLRSPSLASYHLICLCKLGDRASVARQNTVLEELLIPFPLSNYTYTLRNKFA